MIERAVSSFWLRTSHSVEGPDRSLVTLRWLIGVYLLLFEAPHYAWIDRAPRAFFDPPVFSLGHLVGGFPPRPFFLVLDLVAIASIVLMTLGIRARAATVVVVACRLIGTSFLFSFGKIDHTIMLTVLLALMAWCDWGATPVPRPDVDWSRPPVPPRSLRARSLLAVIISFGFLTAGLPKLLHWVDADTSTNGFLSWYYEGVLDLRRDALLAQWIPGLPPWLLELVDVAAVAVEIAAFAALLSGRIAWRGFLLLVSMLHLANVLVLNIEFTAQAMTYLVFADLALRKRSPAAGWRWFAVGGLATVVLWHVQSRLRGRGSPIVFISDYRSQIEFGLYIGALAGVASVVVFSRQILLERRRPEPVSAQ